jgi:hypothetical protein
MSNGAGIWMGLPWSSTTVTGRPSGYVAETYCQRGIVAGGKPMAPRSIGESIRK